MNEKNGEQFCTTLRLIGSCPDKPGIVAKVAGFIAGRGANIIEAGQHQEHASGVFFMRYEIELAADDSEAKFRDGFLPLARELGMEWRLSDVVRKKRVALLVSKYAHCLADLLHRWRFGDLPCEVCCVISNHDALRELAEWNGVPFHEVPIPPGTAGRDAAFYEMAGIIADAGSDVIVLARYMQVLPPWLCERYENRIINIHHSFLPSFAGANPYRQAVERGVKLIGATCHYVTAELDAGPIIEQDVVRVRHNDSLKDMTRLGKDVENTVLSRGLLYHLEDRVLVHKNKTVLFY